MTQPHPGGPGAGQSATFLAQVHVDVTGRCNLGCRYCVAPGSTSARPDMQLEAFERIADNVLRWARSVHFDGCGEPLLNPLLPEMIAAAHARSLEVELSTNGTLLSEAMVERLVDAGLDLLNVSMDALDGEVLAALRPGIPWEQTRGRLQALLSRARRPKVKLHVVLTGPAMQVLERTIAAAASLGFDAVNVAAAYDIGTQSAPAPVASEELAEEVLSKAKRAAAACGLELSHGAVRAGAAGGCGFRVDENCIVRADGSVGPCCALFFEVPLRYRGITGLPHGVSRFGDALQEDFRAIWSSERYVAFRDTLRRGQSPAVCLGCPAHYGVG